MSKKERIKRYRRLTEYLEKEIIRLEESHTQIKEIYQIKIKELSKKNEIINNKYEKLLNDYCNMMVYLFEKDNENNNK